jgi:hypothetical protein
MKRDLTLTISSLLTILLSTLHMSDDTIHANAGVDATGVTIMLGIVLVMVYGTVRLGGRRARYVIMLLGGLAAAYMPYLHGMGPDSTRWGFFFIWTMFLMGATGIFTAVLAAQELWRSFAGPARPRSE